jgi:prepilin-type N-terminal cleavage/methylation domain-containing protein
MAARRVEGFSLIELMVVCAIIGLSVIAFAPSFVLSMADRRAAAAASEVVRIGRQARADAIGTQRPHLVWMRMDDGAEESGIVQLLRGTSGPCDIQRWLALSLSCAGINREADSRVCLASLDLNTDRWFRDPLQIRLRTVERNREAPAQLISALTAPDSNNYAICYEATGATRWAVLLGGLTDPVTTFSERNDGLAAGGGFLFTAGVVDKNTSDVKSVPRVLAYPLGTTPRRLR